MMKTYDILKLLSKTIYVVGAGDFWYEDNQRSNIYYSIYSTIVFLILDIFNALELLVYILPGFPKNYAREGGMLGMTHLLITLKRYHMRYYQDISRALNRDMVNVCRLYEDEETYKLQYKKIRFNFIIFSCSVYITILLFVVKGFQRLFSGEPFITAITYWPLYEDVSVIASTARILNVFVFLFMMAVVVSTDSLIMSHIIIIGHKYMTLRKYFEHLRIQFDSSQEDAIEKAKQLCKGCREGVIMHQDLLRLIGDFQKSFGVPMSIHVCLCSGSAVLLLLQFALSKEMNITGISLTCFFLVGLLVMLALILWNAGDITHEASLLSDAIFTCGWHLSAVQKPLHQDTRQLVLLACGQAQRPLVLKAFGITSLSYETFVAVVRTTYSVFAVVYKSTT